jgi:hypothetical protein
LEFEWDAQKAAAFQNSATAKAALRPGGRRPNLKN